MLITLGFSIRNASEFDPQERRERCRGWGLEFRGQGLEVCRGVSKGVRRGVSKGVCRGIAGSISVLRWHMRVRKRRGGKRGVESQGGREIRGEERRGRKEGRGEGDEGRGWEGKG